MVKTIIQDQTMLFLVLAVAFFVGGSITEVFYNNEAEAKTDITNIEIVEDFRFVLSDTSDDEAEYKEGDHVGKSCPFKDKKRASINTDLNI